MTRRDLLKYGWQFVAAVSIVGVCAYNLNTGAVWAFWGGQVAVVTAILLKGERIREVFQS